MTVAQWANAIQFQVRSRGQQWEQEYISQSSVKLDRTGRSQKGGVNDREGSGSSSSALSADCCFSQNPEKDRSPNLRAEPQSQSARRQSLEIHETATAEVEKSTDEGAGAQIKRLLRF
jgi:hypothetical protein